MKANDGATGALEELLHVIRFILDKKNLSLKLEPTRNASKPLEIVCFYDGDYVGDLVSRRSVSKFILYLLGVQIS